MGKVRKRGGVSTTTEMEMADEAAIADLRKIRAFLSGASTDEKGARVAQRNVNRFIRLRNQQIAAARVGLTAVRQIKSRQSVTAKRLPKGGA